MTDTDKFNDIYLNLEIRKSTGKTDDFGNYIFEVEASNENLDLQNQIVLQRALMESKDEFLKGGVISFDHLHKRRDEKGNIISDPSMVIGEPIDVYFDETNKKTIVKGKLYSNNEKAKDLIKMLKAGSTRVRASVGGIFPQVVKNLKTGVEKITHVLWSDLALTTSPVNNTVGSAVFAKSMSAANSVTRSQAFQAGKQMMGDAAYKALTGRDRNHEKEGALKVGQMFEYEPGLYRQATVGDVQKANAKRAKKMSKDWTDQAIANPKYQNNREREVWLQ